MDFTVPVKLIAKNVVQQQDARTHVLQRARDRGLVDLEHPDVAAWPAAPVAALGNRGEEPGQQVGPGAVVQWAQASGADDVRDQSGGGGLSIRAAHHYAAVRERASDIAQRGRCQAGDEVASDDGPAAAPETAAEGGGGAAGEQGGTQAGAHHPSSPDCGRVYALRPGFRRPWCTSCLNRTRHGG
jgi:hypothetical protein